MATMSLNATLRKTEGKKGAARKLRATGKVPAVLYRGGEAAKAVTIDPHDVELGFKKTQNPNTLIDLHVDDGTHILCVIREVQRHPVSQVIRHIDFYALDLDKTVDVSVPVVIVGRAAGTRVGGTLVQHSRRLQVRSKPLDIPAAIEVDVTPLNIGQSLKVSSLVPPGESLILYTKDFALAEVVGAKADLPEPAKGA